METQQELKARLAIIEDTIKRIKGELSTALDIERDIKIKIYSQRTGLSIGDKVSFIDGKKPFTGELTAFLYRYGRVEPLVTIYKADGKLGVRTKNYFYDSNFLTKLI